MGSRDPGAGAGQASDARRGVWIVQQGVWDMPLESLPLAAGYLKAMADGDDAVRSTHDIAIRNLRGGLTHVQMANFLFGAELPKVMAFSALGWNVRAFGSLARTYKQLVPDGLVVFGGTHVTNQAERVVREHPDVDVVVNGEGEITFRELLRTGVQASDLRPGCALDDVDGLSWKDRDGTVRTTGERKRIEDLDQIPSPFLTGAVDLVGPDGRFRYDVAIMETNRGCPYKCAFCYWGGAIGQRVRAFSRDRLRQELELFARLEVPTIVACDANFGMLPIDLEFIDDLIDVRSRTGFPAAFETSWAKNKSATFFSIVERMAKVGLKSSFTLALQTLDDAALRRMNRRNMKVNAWKDLAVWLAEQNLDCYAELIWGAPGETVESFIAGYDELSEHVSRIAVYPIMLLPNTEFSEESGKFGIVSIRGDDDDFEYVLAHESMTFAENQQMQVFLFWARVLAENAVLRHVWAGLRRLAGIRQSAVITSFGEWVAQADDVGPLATAHSRAQGRGAPAYAEAIGYLFTDANGPEVIRRWWDERIRPQLPDHARAVLDELLRFDVETQPLCRADQHRDLVPGSRADVRVRPGVRFDVDVVRLSRELRDPNIEVDLHSPAIEVDLHFRLGAANAVLSTNHEEIMHFMAVPVNVVPLVPVTHDAVR
ncbi:KedN5 family methylcobalamin-dependent radical SAM C-methyltransferase [Actinomycetes bacterium KLBMP 9759]